MRAELYLERGYWMTALTSPIFARGKAPGYSREDPSEGRTVTYGHPLARSTYLPIAFTA